MIRVRIEAYDGSEQMTRLVHERWLAPLAGLLAAATVEDQEGLEFRSLVVRAIGDSKRQTIRALRAAYPHIGFKDAKKLVDTAAGGAPAEFPPLPLVEAVRLKRALEAWGAVVSWGRAVRPTPIGPETGLPPAEEHPSDQELRAAVRDILLEFAEEVVDAIEAGEVASAFADVDSWVWEALRAAEGRA